MDNAKNIKKQKKRKHKNNNTSFILDDLGVWGVSMSRVFAF